MEYCFEWRVMSKPVYEAEINDGSVRVGELERTNAKITSND